MTAGTVVSLDNINPSRIIVGCNEGTRDAAECFTGLLAEGAEKEISRSASWALRRGEAVKLFDNIYFTQTLFKEVQNVPIYT